MSRALTFGGVAEQYAKWRPSYPDDAVDWLAPAAPARVADVGAGTGKLTSTLVDRGLTVEAVEPDPLMLDVLARAVPSAIPHESGSDSLPFEEASLDAGQGHSPSDFDADELEVAQFPWVWEVTPEHYAANLATNSAVIAMTDPEREVLLDAARTLLHRVCDETGRSTLPFHHAAACLRWTPQSA